MKDSDKCKDAINRVSLAEDIRNILGTDVTPLIECGLIDPWTARKWLVKQLYILMYNDNRTLTAIKNELSDKYNISVSLIEKMVYRKN